MRFATRSFALLVATTGLVALAAACGGDDDSAPTSSGSGGSSSSALGPCYPTAAKCGISGTKCMALIDVSQEKKKTLRLSQLQVTKPALLASKAIQNTIVGPAVTMKSDKDCALAADPTKAGTFNWLVEFDLTTAGAEAIKTGGAKPVADPAAGYCFLKASYNGLDVGPVNSKIKYDAATGSFETTDPLDIKVPIFLDKDGTKTPIVLPIRGGVIKGGTLSENGNCIGRFRGETGELDPKAECQPTTGDPTDPAAYQYKNGAILEGYVTAEEADQVLIVDLKKSMCSLLANQAEKKMINGEQYDVCKRTADGKLDFSMTTTGPDFKSPNATANDSYRLGAELAASAVKITGDCQ